MRSIGLKLQKRDFFLACPIHARCSICTLDRSIITGDSPLKFFRMPSAKHDRHRTKPLARIPMRASAHIQRARSQLYCPGITYVGASSCSAFARKIKLEMPIGEGPFPSFSHHSLFPSSRSPPGTARYLSSRAPLSSPHCAPGARWTPPTSSGARSCLRPRRLLQAVCGARGLPVAPLSVLPHRRAPRVTTPSHFGLQASA